MQQDNLDDLEARISEVFFQFDDEEPIKFAHTIDDKFSLVLKTDSEEEPSVIFVNGKGKSFKIFIKHGIQ